MRAREEKSIPVSVFKIANELKLILKLLLGQINKILNNYISDLRFMYPINIYRGFKNCC